MTEWTTGNKLYHDIGVVKLCHDIGVDKADDTIQIWILGGEGTELTLDKAHRLGQYLIRLTEDD